MGARNLACFGGIFLLTACATTATAEPAADDLTQSVVLHLGARDVDTGTSSGDDAGGVVGVEYTSRCWGWLGWEGGLSYSEHEQFLAFVNVDKSIDVAEASLGARAIWRGLADGGAGLLPYASAGVSALALAGDAVDDGAVGGYVRGGLCHVFRGGFTLGCDVKFLVTSSDDIEHYGQFTVQSGWSF